MISDKTVDKLNALPLPDVMRNNGYLPASQTARSVFSRCPFHDENNGSFCVSKFPPKGERYAAFNCFVCGEQNRSKGVGAIMLQQRLLERAGEKHDFPDAVNRLAKDFNLIIEGDYKNGFFHRARNPAPQPQVLPPQSAEAFKPSGKWISASVRASLHPLSSVRWAARCSPCSAPGKTQAKAPSRQP